MSILDRISLRGNWPDHLREILPRITLTQIEAFARLIAADQLLDDHGQPTEAYQAWCEDVA